MNAVVLPDRTDGARWLLELMGVHPEASFLQEAAEGRAWAWMPSSLEQSLTTQALNIARTLVLKPEAELEALRATAALGWEVACIQRAMIDGETLDTRASHVKSTLTGYPQYAKKQRLSQAPVGAEHKLRLQNDVPILRQTEHGDLPYIVECKHTRSHPLGQSYSAPHGADHHVEPRSLNQLLRYQAAIDHRLIAGATLEIKGRVHPGLLRWATEGFDGQGSLVPGLEIIWNAPLPSGDTFRVLVKAGVGGGRWKPSQPHSLADRAAAAGINACLEDPDRFREAMLGAIEVERIPDPSVRALLTTPFVLPNGTEALPLHKPAEILDVATWRAFIAEANRQVLARWENPVLQAAPTQVAPTPTAFRPR